MKITISDLSIPASGGLAVGVLEGRILTATGQKVDTATGGALSRAIGVPRTRLNDVVLGRRGITADTAGNRVVKDAIKATRKSIEGGRTIAAPLKASGVFPALVVQMIAVGEETGALDTMLTKIAQFYEDEVDTAVAGLMALLEPMMIVFLGVVIGGIVVAMYLPMFDLINKI